MTRFNTATNSAPPQAAPANFRTTVSSSGTNFIGSSKYKSWLIWGLAGLFYLYEMILRAGAGVMTEGIMDTFAINATELGILSSFYYYAYVILQIPSGLLADKFGPRIVISISSLICTLATFLFATTDSLMVAQIARFLVGAGSACAFISCLKLATDWFRPTSFVLIAALTNMLGTIGGTFAGAPLASIVDQLGWKSTTMCLAYVGIAVTVACYLGIRNQPTTAIGAQGYKPITPSFTPPITTPFPYKSLIFDRNIIMIGCIGGLMYVPISSFAELWAIPFLTKSLNVNNQWASFASSMIFIGMALGSPIMAQLASYRCSYIKVMRLTCLLSIVGFTVVTFAQHLGYWVTFASLLLSGIFLGGQVLCFSVVKMAIPNKISATAMAYTNMLVMFSGVMFQPLLGVFLDMGWQGNLNSISGARNYSADAYQHAMLAIPLCLLVAYGLLKFLRDQKIKNLI